MQLEELRQYLISHFDNLNHNGAFEKSHYLTPKVWADAKLAEQQKLDKLKRRVNTFKLIAYLLSAITGITALLKIFGDYTWIDLNKASLLILLTITNTVTAFSLSMQLSKLEKKIMIIEILSRFPV